MHSFKQALDLILRRQPSDLSGFNDDDRRLLDRAESVVSSVDLLTNEIVDLRSEPADDHRAEAAIEFIAITNPAAADSIMAGARC